MENSGRAGQSTDDNVIRRMHFAYLITKATNTPTEYVILMYHGNIDSANAPGCLRCTCLACLFVCVYVCVWAEGVETSPIYGGMLVQCGEHHIVVHCFAPR